MAFVVFVLMAVFFICCLVSSIIMCVNTGDSNRKVSIVRLDDDIESSMASEPMVPVYNQ